MERGKQRHLWQEPSALFFHLLKSKNNASLYFRILFGSGCLWWYTVASGSVADVQIAVRSVGTMHQLGLIIKIYILINSG